MLEVIIQVRWKNMTLLYSQSIIYIYIYIYVYKKKSIIYIYINFPIYGSISTTIGECASLHLFIYLFIFGKN